MRVAEIGDGRRAFRSFRYAFKIDRSASKHRTLRRVPSPTEFHEGVQVLFRFTLS